MDNHHLEQFDKEFIRLLNDSNTQLSSLYNKSSHDIAELFGVTYLDPPPIPSNINNEIAKEIKKQLLFIIDGNLLNFGDIRKLYRQTQFNEYYHSKRLLGSFNLKIYEILINVMRENPGVGFTDDINQWAKSINHLYALIHLIGHSSPDWKLRNFSEALLYFEALGFKFNLSFSELSLDGDDTNKSLLLIENEIDNKVKSYGVNFYHFILVKLSDFTQKEYDRVIFPQRFESWRDKEKVNIYPLGLALKYAVRHTRKLPQPLTEQDGLNILDYMRQYSNLFQLHDYSEWESINSPFAFENYLIEVTRNIYFDQLYSIVQLPGQYISKLLSIFDSFEIQNIKFRQELDLFKLLFNNYPFQTPYILDLPKLQYALKDIEIIINRIVNLKISSANVSLWNNRTQQSEGVALYTILGKLSVQQKKVFVFYNHPCLNLLVFEYFKIRAKDFFVAEYSVRNCDKNASEAYSKIYGNAFELLLENEFKFKQLSYLSKKEYNVNDNPKLQLLNIVKGETDFIITSKKNILVFECKAKQLSPTARLDNTSMILDVYSSFIYSQFQAKKVEYLLKEQKLIIFEDGSRLQLDGRAVYTITVSITETFDSLMDVHFSRNIFEYFRAVQFSTTTENKELKKSFERINKKLKCLQEITNFNTKNIYFLSFQQILTLLKYSNNIDEFIEYINKKSVFTTGSKDWYADFISLRTIQKTDSNVFASLPS